MGEIIEERSHNVIDGCSSVKDQPNEEKVEIILRTVGPSRPSRLLVPSSISVHDLRKLVARNHHAPVENLRLVLRGNVLHDKKNDDDAYLELRSGDSLIVAVKPKQPAKHLHDGFDEDDDDEVLKFQLPQTANRWKRRLYHILHDNLKLPDVLLMAIFSLSLKAWAAVVVWFILAPIAHRWELGPLYILGTGFAIILLNLGRRQPGEISAYSIFNEDFRELPGTLNADRLDRDIRAGQF